MTNLQTTINGITYEIVAEIELTGKAASGNYSNLAYIKRPKGTKQFLAMRNKVTKELEILNQ